MSSKVVGALDIKEKSFFDMLKLDTYMLITSPKFDKHIRNIEKSPCNTLHPV